MNIYLHLEIAARELDSKLLLAILAAEKGHNVIISNMREIMNGLRNGVFPPGIFHTKSLTPSKSKINRHQEIVDKKFIITSIDEESGIDQYSYDQFARDRYSERTIEQASAVFCWGLTDSETLKKKYTENSSKIFKTGSPRVDLWKHFFRDYWIAPKKIPKKPFLLVSSNMNCTNMLNFHENIKFHKEAGYFERDPNLFKNFFNMIAEDYKKLYSFIDAIKFIAKNNQRFDIVVRPHPTENIKAWEVFLDGLPNVHIIREDSISTWVKHSFAVMHNGCTTAIEASISGKPVITFKPFEMEYAHELSNSLGHVITSNEDLKIKVNEILDSDNTNNLKENEKSISETVLSKLYIDQNELAAEKILKVWELFDDKKYSEPINLNKLYLLKIINIRKNARNFLIKLFPKLILNKENYKFPPLNHNMIASKISRMQDILGIRTKLECKLISDYVLLIKKF